MLLSVQRKTNPQEIVDNTGPRSLLLHSLDRFPQYRYPFETECPGKVVEVSYDQQLGVEFSSMSLSIQD